MQQPFDYGALDEILAANGCREAAIIAILQDVQERYRYLPREVFPYLSQKLQISEARIFSVATFYENFSLEAKGRYVFAFATEPPAMFENRFRFSSGCEKSLACRRRKRRRTIWALRWKPSPALGHAGWLPCSRSTRRCIRR